VTGRPGRSRRDFLGLAPGGFAVPSRRARHSGTDTHRRFLRASIFGPGCNSRRLHHFGASRSRLRRDFAPPARLGSLHSLPLRRVAPFRSRFRAWRARSPLRRARFFGASRSRRRRDFAPPARLDSLHSLPLRRVAPFRSRCPSTGPTAYAPVPGASNSLDTFFIEESPANGRRSREAFYEHLTEDASAPGPEREPHAHLPLPPRASVSMAMLARASRRPVQGTSSTRRWAWRTPLAARTGRSCRRASPVSAANRASSVVCAVDRSHPVSRGQMPNDRALRICVTTQRPLVSLEEDA
jgi:hypothetical protein